MRHTLLAAAAALVISSPAMARDGAPYIGIELGAAMSDEAFFDVDVDTGADSAEFRNALNVDYKIGIDADVIAGYDFGMIRAEAELAYKRLGIEEVTLNGPLGAAIGDDFDEDDFGSAKVTSLMGNLLLDTGGDSGVGAYVGGGLGPARVKIAGESDSGLAWQAIAGVRTAITPNLDLGLKYRYFNSGKLNYGDGDGVEVNGRLKTHSLLASLIYNFASPPPPPPPPPAPPVVEAPATQTCPDGTVILATESCPVPPPPPPPPPAGERG